jgi:hypothetical protein
MLTSKLRLLLSFLLLAGACDSGDDAGGGGDADADAEGGSADGSTDDTDAAPSPYGAHLIRPSCAPNDGAAVRILLGEAIGGDGCNVDDGGAIVDLEVWTRDIEAPETVEFGDGDFTGAGTACPGGEEPCFTYQEGAIHFDRYDDGTGAAGSFTLGSGNEQVSGTFDATWCEPDPPEPCG